MIIGILKYLIYMIAFFIIMKIANYIFQLIYFLFFKKNKNAEINESEKNLTESVKMLQCEKCKTYISKSEAYIHNGKIFCKKEHSQDI